MSVQYKAPYDRLIMAHLTTKDHFKLVEMCSKHTEPFEFKLSNGVTIKITPLK